MKAVVIALAIVMFIACLVLGIQAGNASIRWSGSTPTTHPASSPQRTVLLIGVNDLSQPNPLLVSVWLALYRSDLPRITLLPLYPSISDQNAEKLADSFRLQPDGAVAPEFLEEIKAYHINWDGYLIIDHPGTARLVDFLGGLEMNGTVLEGSKTVEWLSTSSLDPQTSLQAQRQVGEAICSRLATISEETGWDSLQSELVGKNLRATLDIARLSKDWRSIRNTSNLACEIPQP